MRAASRPVIASVRAAGRRAASSSSSSSTPNPAQNEQVQKAVEQAQKYYSQGSAAVQKFAGPVGDKVGAALGSYRQPLTFNFKVFTSLCRQVYQAEKLSFPTDLHAWASSYAQIWARASNLKYWQEIAKTGAWAGVAVASIEAYGIFSLGEIIGRRNLVGYKLKDN